MGLDMYLYAEVTAHEGLSDLLTPEQNVEIDREAEGTYVSGYGFCEEAEKDQYCKIVDRAGLQDLVDPETPILYVKGSDDAVDEYVVQATVGYWRKANAIHRWFVDECQDGVDECQLSDPISREKLQELRRSCLMVIGSAEMAEGEVVTSYTFEGGARKPVTASGLVMKNPEVAEEHLPTASGFFFGGTEYDDWYVKDLELTVEQIDRALKAPPEAVFRYCSSW